MIGAVEERPGVQDLEILWTAARRTARLAGALCVLFAAVSPPAAAEPGGPAERIAAANLPLAVVIFGTRRDSGAPVQSSGCVVDARGIVLTTAHQIGGVDDLRGKTADGRAFALTPEVVDEALDFSLLRADARFDGAVSVGSSASLRVGAPLVSLSTPLNLEFSLVSGLVSSLNRTYRSVPVFQAEMNTSPGSSGAPVFDARGDLVGIVLGRLNDQPWMTVVLPVDRMHAGLDRLGVARPRPPAEAQEDAELAPEPGITEMELWALEAYNAGVRADACADKARMYERAVQLLPAFFEAWFNLGLARAGCGDGEGAAAAYESARKLRPEALAPLRNLGLLRLEAGDPGGALECFREAARLAPEDARVQNDLGVALQRAERHAEAADAFRESLRIAPGHPPAMYNLAVSLLADGQEEAARRAFAEYLERFPDAPEADSIRALAGTDPGNQEQKR